VILKFSINLVSVNLTCPKLSLPFNSLDKTLNNGGVDVLFVNSKTICCSYLMN